jgi:hypothetical protein
MRDDARRVGRDRRADRDRRSGVDSELKRKSGCREKGVRTRIGDLVSIDDLAAQPNL